MKNSDTFYKKNNTSKEIAYYKRLLGMMGSLSNLFADSSNVYIHSRVAENLFCMCLNAENLSRSDITADAKKGKVGIGIKTWVGTDYQKIAEFDSAKKEYDNLKIEDKVLRIAQLRNDRIDFTMRNQALEKMIYHCIYRKTNEIFIKECKLEKINISKIKNIEATKSSVFFEDNKNKYRFQFSKSTLYKCFDDLIQVDKLLIDVIDNPYDVLEKALHGLNEITEFSKDIEIESIFLPLYSYSHGEKIVNEKSGLNQRFASGRRRDPYEVYIPINSYARKKIEDFFPDRDENFSLHLPNGKIISAKICQDNGKALMSNPNQALGQWLIDDVFKISPSKKITYNTLEKYGIDSVVIQKRLNTSTGDRYYSINFAKIGSFEAFIKGIDIRNDN